MIDASNGSSVSDAFQPRAFERNILTVAKGGGVTFAGKLFLTASRFVIAVLLARLLGAEELGLYNLAISAGSLASGLALLGMDAALVRYIAISTGRRDEAGVWGALHVGVGGAMLFSVLISTGLFALAYPVAELAFHEPRLAPLLQLVSAIVPLLTLSELLAGATRGFKKMEHSVIAQSIAQPVIRLILTLALALVGMNAVYAVIIYGLADGAASVIMLSYLNQQFSLRRPLRAARRDTAEILGFALPFWLSGLITTFQVNLQTLLVGAMNSIAGVGVFSVAANLNSLGNLFSSSINISSRPIVAELFDRGDRVQLGHIYRTAAKWALMVNLPVFLIMLLFPAPILSIFGEGFTEGATALAILACANLVNVGTGMGGIILDMIGYSKLKLANSIIRLVLHLVLNVLLIPRWGIVGAATAVLIAEGTINVVRLLEVFFLLRLLPYDRSFAKPVLAGSLALAGALGVGLLLPDQAKLLSTALQALVLCVVYVGATLLLGLSPLERDMLARLRRRASAMIGRT